MAETENNVDQTDTETQEKFNCQVNVADSGPWKKKITVDIPREEIDKEMNKQYGDLVHSAEIPGFRKGHAPRKLIEKRYGQDVTSQVKLQLMTKAFKQIDEEQDFEILGDPDFDPEKIELPESGDFHFDYEVEVKPKFELPALEGIQIEKKIYEINEERVNDALEEFLRRNGELVEINDEAAQEGDVLRADITMTVEGIDQPETFPDHPLRVAESGIHGVWIEEMAAVLEGVKAGETRTCSATVPDTHAKEEYRGKKAQFSIRVNILKRLIPAEVNEEFLAKVGLESEEELKKAIESSLENQTEREVRNSMKQQVSDYLNKNVNFDLPTGVATKHANQFLVRRYYELLNQGISSEIIEENIEKLRSASSEQAAQNLKMEFIMDAVADKLEIEVSEGEINAAIAQMAAVNRRRPESLKNEMQKEGRLDNIRSYIRDEKAIDKILEMAQVVDAPVEEEKKPKKKTPKTAAKKTEKKTPKKEVKRTPPSADNE